MADVEDDAPVMSNGVVSAVDNDSLECLSNVQASAYNTHPQSSLLKSDSKKIIMVSDPQQQINNTFTNNSHEHNSNHLTASSLISNTNQAEVDEPSLHELIEAELTSRFATQDTLAPDSLEHILDEQFSPTCTSEVSKMNGHVVATCATIMDSLEVDLDNSPFSLDSLADSADSGEKVVTNGRSIDVSPRHNSVPIPEARQYGVVITPNVDFLASLEFIAPPTKVENISQEVIDIKDEEVIETNLIQPRVIENGVITNGHHREEDICFETTEVIENTTVNGELTNGVVETLELIENSLDTELVPSTNGVSHEIIEEYLQVESSQIESIIESTKSYNMIDVVDPGVSNGSGLLSAVNVTNGGERKETSEEEEAEAVEENAWPEEKPKSKQLDEFEKMEEEVMKEMEENKKNDEEKKKKKRRDGKDGDKKGKKKKKRTDSEKENKHSFSDSAEDADEEVFGSHYSEAHESSIDESGVSRLGSQGYSESGPDASQCSTPSVMREDEDELSGISVRTLTASYLSSTADNTQHSSPVRSSSPILRPRTPISRLVDTYSSPASCQKSNHSSTSPTQVYPSDFTPGVTHRNLKCLYESSASRSLSPISGCSPVPKEEVPNSFSSMRDAYCNVARMSPTKSERSVSPIRTTPLKMPLAMKELDNIQVPPECRICNKIVFQMEKIVAEKASWHKNCFRCTDCSKNLTAETYQSNDGLLYCKPHFKNLFKPKAVIQDEAEERKDRPTSKPDYGLEELQQMNVRQRFAKFELLNQEEERPSVLEPVKRSRSLMSKAARFLEGNDDKGFGVDNDELGEYEEEEEEEEEEEDEEEEEVEGEDGQVIVKSRKKKERPMSFSGMGDLKSAWEQKQRREEMSIARKEEISKFRMMLCAGKNMSLKEKFESGNFDEEDEERENARSEIVIEGSTKASNLRARFEQGEPFTLEENGEVNRSAVIGSEKQEVEEIFREAETAKKARNVFRNIDSHVASEGAPVMRSSSFAANPANRLSIDGVSTGDEADVFGRDPNLIRCSDKYEDDVDCRNTKNILNMFKKMELGAEDEEDEDGPRPLKRFTPPPEDGRDYSSSEYTDSEDDYTDDEDYEDEEEEEEENGEFKSKFKDELLDMKTTPQSAKKAGQIRAKFEKWEANQKSEKNETALEDDEEARPSIDTARNLKAMFENKMAEDAKVHTSKQRTKVSRFV